MSEVTPWFDQREQEPWEPGLYKRRIRKDDLILWSVWDGRRWGWSSTSKKCALDLKDIPSYCQLEKGNSTEWRGLSSDPSKRKEAK